MDFNVHEEADVRVGEVGPHDTPVHIDVRHIIAGALHHLCTAIRERAPGLVDHLGELRGLLAKMGQGLSRELRDCFLLAAADEAL